LPSCTAAGEGIFARGESVTVTCTTTSAGMSLGTASCSDEEDF
jgi:hypothetical protein